MEKQKPNILSLLVCKSAKVNRTSKIALGVTLAFALLMTGLSAYNSTSFDEITASLVSLGELSPESIDQARKPDAQSLPGQDQPTELGTTGTVVENSPTIVNEGTSSSNNTGFTIEEPVTPKVLGGLGETTSTGITANNPKYDLYVAPNSVTISPDDLKVSDRIQVKSEVKNIGTSNITSPFDVAITLKYVNTGSSLNSPITIPQLAAGASFPIQVSFPAVQVGGVYEISISADSGNAISETNEGNNSDTFITDIPRIADVNVISVNSDPNQVKQGEDFKIKTSISNTGSKDYTNDITIYFQVNSESKQVVKTGGLKRGESIDREATFTAGMDSNWVGRQPVKVYVNTTSDGNSDNNSGSSEINILSEIFNCVDPDQGDLLRNNKATTVTITNRDGKKLGEKTDSCKDSSTVIEYGCINGDAIGTEVKCHPTETCSNGACVALTSCFETDKGDDPAKGTTTLKDYTGKTIETQTDSCDANGRTIIEYYCSYDTQTGKAKIVKDTSSSCTLDQKCVDGACVDKTASDIPGDYQCTDMHTSGVDYKFAKGIVNLFKGSNLQNSVADRCYTSPLTGKEYKIQFGCYNKESAKVANIIPCEGSCTDGACEAVKPDVSISAIYWHNNNPGTEVTVETKNSGSSTIPAGTSMKLNFSIDGKTISQTVTAGADGWKAGNVDRKNFGLNDFSLSNGKNFTVDAEIDADNQVAETNESNNKKSQVLTWPSNTNPDLEISSIYWANSKPGGNITVETKNTGTADIPLGKSMKLNFTIDGKTVSQTITVNGTAWKVGNLLRNEFNLNDFSLSNGKNFTVDAEIDADNQVAEQNEDNNKKSQVFTWPSAGTQDSDLIIKHVAWNGDANNRKVESVVLNIGKGVIPSGTEIQLAFTTREKQILKKVTLSEALTKTTWIKFEVSPSELGITPGTTFTIRATVDPTNTIEESDEGNNEKAAVTLTYDSQVTLGSKNTGGIVISPLPTVTEIPNTGGIFISPFPTGNAEQLWKSDADIRIAKQKLLDAVLLMAKYAEQKAAADTYETCKQPADNEVAAWNQIKAAAEALREIADKIQYGSKVEQFTRYIDRITEQMNSARQYCADKFGEPSQETGTTQAEQARVAELNKQINELSAAFDGLIADAEGEETGALCRDTLTSSGIYEDLIGTLDALATLYADDLKQEAAATEVNQYIEETKKKYNDTLKMCEEKNRDPEVTGRMKAVLQEVNSRIPEVEQAINYANASTTSEAECKATLNNNTIFDELEAYLSELVSLYANAGMREESQETEAYLKSIVSEWDGALASCDSKGSVTESVEQQTEEVLQEVANDNQLLEVIEELATEVEKAKTENPDAVKELEETLTEAKQVQETTVADAEKAAAEAAAIEKAKQEAAAAQKAADDAKKAAEAQSATAAQKAAAEAAQNEALKKQLEAQNKVLEALRNSLTALNQRTESKANVICRLSPDSEACKRARGDVKDVEVRIVQVAASQKEVAAKTAKQTATTPAQKQEAEKQLTAVKATKAAIERTSAVGTISDEVVKSTMAKDFPKQPADAWYAKDLVKMRLSGCVNPGDFTPDKFITRAEAAKILSCVRLGKDFESKLNDKNFKKLFNDASDGQWFYDPTMYLYGEGIIQGYQSQVGPFYRESRPSSNGNRAEILALLLKAYGLNQPIAHCTTPFKDVPQTEWYSCNVKKASDLGILKGYGDGTFRPATNINRAEFIKLLNALDDRAAQLTE